MSLSGWKRSRRSVCVCLLSIRLIRTRSESDTDVPGRIFTYTIASRTSQREDIRTMLTSILSKKTALQSHQTEYGFYGVLSPPLRSSIPTRHPFLCYTLLLSPPPVHSQKLFSQRLRQNDVIESRFQPAGISLYHRKMENIKKAVSTRIQLSDKNLSPDLKEVISIFPR